MHPESPVVMAAVALAFISQAAPDVKQKLQRVERLGEESERLLIKEKVQRST